MQVSNLERGSEEALTRLEEFLELAKSAKISYELASPEKKRDLARKLTSNLKAVQKNVDVELKIPARLIAERSKSTCSAPQRGVPRTWDNILGQLLAYFTEKGLAENQLSPGCSFILTDQARLSKAGGFLSTTQEQIKATLLP